MQLLTILLGASALITPALAQTWTLCNPTINETCPNDPGFGIDHTWDFKESKAVKQSFTITNGKLAFGDDGTEFVINKQKESPTIQSKFYIMFGSVSVVMKAASGRGIVSSIVVQSECLDEIDWEFIGGNGTHAQTNYFGKGNTTSFDRDEWHPVSGDVRETFHNYTVDWKADKMDFYIDSKWVRTLKYGDANGGKNYPQTPSTVRLGVWAGGDKENNNVGTVEWAGGETDFAQAPFTMVVKSTHVKDYGSGKEYEWTDKTGNWQTIKGIPGDSAAAQLIAKGLDAEEETPDEATGTATDSNTIQSGKNADASSTESDSTTTSDAAASSGTADKAEETEKSIAQKWTEMPQTSKVAIYAGGGAGAALLLGAFLFVCIRQRRRGREERDAYNAKVEKEREDAYQDQMELREKGLGGWDKNAYASQGDDALGGWGGTHVANSTPTASSAPKFTAVATHEIPSRSSSPDSHHIAAAPSPWTGGNQGGMIHNAHNAYNGGYSQNTNIPRSPNFPLASQGGGPFNAQGAFPPSGNGGGFGGSQHGGYQRF